MEFGNRADCRLIYCLQEGDGDGMGVIIGFEE